ncbi:MAG: helix-turn-helix transcriptional regulator [Actinomycetota bacterium]|nr:helix-turn-helix transcriptional regulator [Actinomycetota bacterium]
MDLKEAVDILGMLLEGKDRKPQAAELRRVGSMILDLAREMDTVPGGKPLSLDELERALGYLENHIGELGGDALREAMDLRKNLVDISEGREKKSRHGHGVINQPQLNIKYKDTETKDRVIEPVMEADEEEAYEAKREPVPSRQNLISGNSLTFREGRTLGRMLRDKRLSLGLKQKEVAERIGVSPSYLSLLENERCPRISRRLKERVEAFLEREGDTEGVVEVPANASTGTSNLNKKGVTYTRTCKGGKMEVEGIDNSHRREDALKKLLQASLRLGREELLLLYEIARRLGEEN